MLSPPNFSRNASERTMAIMASPTTPAAGTAQTSLRSTTASTASSVVGEDAGGGHGADVAPLDDRVHRLLRGEVHRLERRAEGRERLHRGPDDDRLAVRHSALEAAGVVRLALEPALGVEEDLIVDGRARASRGFESKAQLAALDRLGRAEGLPQPALGPPCPLPG